MTYDEDDVIRGTGWDYSNMYSLSGHYWNIHADVSILDYVDYPWTLWLFISGIIPKMFHDTATPFWVTHAVVLQGV